jgi:hypothetical protein
MNTDERLRKLEDEISKMNGILMSLTGGSGYHNILSGTHADSDPATLQAGDIIIANNTPKWARLPKDSDAKVLMLASGLPAWADLPDVGGGGQFEDTFDDADIHWAWTTYNTGVNRIVAEASGVLQIWGKSGNSHYFFNGPSIHIGAIGYPMIVETKISSGFSINDLTAAGLHFSKSITAGTNAQYLLEKRRDDGNTQDGIYVMRWSTQLANVNPMTTLPVWLRMRVGGAQRLRSTLYFDYSINGSTWINITSDSNSGFSPGIYGMTSGMYVRNWTIAYPEIDVDFEHFKMTLQEGPG